MKNKQDFFDMVWQVVREIPRGKVTTYGAIAKFIGTTSSARTVGWAMNAAHNDKTIPAHRVVNRLGMLSGKMHFSTPFEMEDLLKNEGILVENNKIINFNAVFWDPNSALQLK